MVKSGQSSLSALGGGFSSDLDEESRVKKVKRFLASKYSDFDFLYFPFIRALRAGLSLLKQELILVIDGTDLGGSCGGLMLSVAWGKRSIPLCWLVKEGNKGHFSVAHYLALVSMVCGLLPECPSIVLLGDGEFDSCELQEFAQNQGWNYVLRTAKNTLIEDRQGDTYKVGELAIPKQTDYLWLEDCAISRQRYGAVGVLLWHQKTAPEPMYLLSNMEWAQDMMDYYKKRWSIETLFADLKSRAFNIHQTKLSKPERLANLLMIIAIAFTLCLMIGESKKEFQKILPKIVRKDRVNSLGTAVLGKKIFHFYNEQHISIESKLNKVITHYFCVRL